jgi:Membrane iron-sulfur containing protein FtrD-like
MSAKNEQEPVSRAGKRARFAGQQEKKPSGASPVILIAGLAVVLALIGGTVFALTGSSTRSLASSEPPAGTPSSDLVSYPTGSQGLLVKAATVGHDPYPLVEAKEGVVQFPLSTFDDYQAHFYTYMNAGRPIEFFVLRSKDGVVRAAFNACDVCFPAKKGYHQEGDEMVCNNCGSRFPANKINEVRGGCNPSPLDRTVNGDTLTIKVDDILRGLDYF